MNKKILRALIASAICSLATTAAWAANTGGELKDVSGYGWVYIGEYNPVGAANDHVISIDSNVEDDSGDRKSVIGGLGSSTGQGIAAKGNSVTITGGEMHNVFAGYANAGTIDNNSVTVSGGTMYRVYGGYSPYGENADVTNNIVVFNSGTAMGEVFAGYTGGDNATGIATGNKLYINGGTLGDANFPGGLYMMGGQGKESINNEVHMTAGAVNGYIVGGQSQNSGVAQANKVVIGGGTVSDDVYGGYTNGLGTGNVLSNTVEINGTASVGGKVYGGYSEGSGNVNNNTVDLQGGHVSGVYGGAAGFYYTGDTASGSADGNTATITNTTVNGAVYGGYSAKQYANNNTVTIKDSEVSSMVHGGFTGFTAPNGSTSTENSGNASANIVDIEGGSVGSAVYGGRVYSASGAANNNQVNISGNTQISGAVHGGATGAAVAGQTGGDASNNTITISGGILKDSVYGAYSASSKTTGNTINISGNAAINGSYIMAGFGKTESSGNKVVIKGTPTFGSNTTIWGASGTIQNNNTLEIHTKNLTAANIHNFTNYNFYLPTDMVKGETVLTLTGSKTDISNSKVAVGIAGSSAALKPGESVNLLKNNNGIKADGIINGKLQQGISIEYEFDTLLSADGKNFVARLKGGGSVTEQSKSPVETQIAAVGFVNSGADMISASGIQNAATAAASSNTPEMFGAMGAGMTRQQSGSYTDVKGYNLALGFAKSINNKSGKLVVGPFVEAGWGNYTTHLDSGIRGDGSTQYYGIGLLARQENKSGIYYEGSLRGGILKSDYSSNDLIGADGSAVRSSYDSSSAYYGLHIAIGKVTQLNDKVQSNIYAKLMYTHQNGDTVNLQGSGNGETYKFDAVDSVRTRFGFRWNKDFGIRNTGYVGVAYEYEFGGEARATVNGFSTPAPSIKGSSGMLEVGYIIQPKNNKGIAIDIGLQGWGGKKSGINGNVNLIWKI